MRPQLLVLPAVLLALGAPPAHAQFAFSPRRILGAMTRPLRQMLGPIERRHYYRHHRRHAAEHGRAEKAASRDRSDVKEAKAEIGLPPGRSSLNAYDDVLGYAFWPDDYADEFRSYGYGDIAQAIVGPLRPAPSTNGSAVSEGADPAPDPAVLPVCRNADASTGDWLNDRMEQALHPDAAQRRSFARLRSRLAEGAKAIRASCQAPLSSSPTARLADLTQRLWALRNAGVLARHAIKTFYDSLSEKQKAAFVHAGQTKAVAARKSKPAPQDQRYRACAAQSAGASARLLGQIEHQVRPTPAQQASLDALRKTSARMEKLLLASCAQPVAKDPLARLDAANQRLVAMNLAATNMEVALNDFYAALDPRRQAKFKSLGR